jgi:replication fork protection complex subunit Csm3/Swi3
LIIDIFVLIDHSLLSERGISKLRKLSKSRLKFKGKGHELSDAQRLLIFYQLWLDDLFPKAKFADGLAIIEKLGHKKRMTTMRREWIDEEKPKHDVLSDEDDFRQQATKSGDNQNQETVARPQTPSRPNVVADDLYGVSPQAVPSNPISKSREKQDLGLFLSDGEDGPEEDELDALLAEDTEVQASAALQSSVLPLSKPVDDYDDEFEAMGGIGDPW